MIDSFVFHRYKDIDKNIDVSLTFNDNQIPFKRFTTEVEWRQEEVPKGQESGLWGSRPFMGKRVFRVEGDILRDTSTQYIQKRLDMLKMFDPDPRLDVIGRLDIQFTGMSELLTSEVGLEGYPELPIDALSPSRGEFMIAWKSNDPYLYGPESAYANIALTPGTTNITTSGNALTRAVKYRLTGPMDEPIEINNDTIEVNLLNPQIVYTDPDLLASEVVIIDALERTVLKDGTDKSQFFKGRDMYLLRGTNVLWFDKLFGTGTVEVSFRNGYII